MSGFASETMSHHIQTAHNENFAPRVSLIHARKDHLKSFRTKSKSKTYTKIQTKCFATFDGHLTVELVFALDRIWLLDWSFRSYLLLDA